MFGGATGKENQESGSQFSYRNKNTQPPVTQNQNVGISDVSGQKIDQGSSVPHQIPFRSEPSDQGPHGRRITHLYVLSRLPDFPDEPGVENEQEEEGEHGAEQPVHHPRVPPDVVVVLGQRRGLHVVQGRVVRRVYHCQGEQKHVGNTWEMFGTRPERGNVKKTGEV